MKSRHSGADGQLRRRHSGAVGGRWRSTSGRPANRSGEGARVGGPRWRDHGVTHVVMPEAVECARDHGVAHASRWSRWPAGAADATHRPARQPPPRGRDGLVKRQGARPQTTAVTARPRPQSAHAAMLETMEGTTRPSKRFHAAAHLFACAAVAHTLGGPPRGETKFKVHPLAKWSDLYPGPVHVQSWWQETPSLS